MSKPNQPHGAAPDQSAPSGAVTGATSANGGALAPEPTGGVRGPQNGTSDLATQPTTRRNQMSDDVTTTEQDDLTFEVTVTATNGVQVPLEIQVKYPAGYGFYAAKALEAMPDNMDGIWNDLIYRQDASTLKVMMASGHYAEEEE